MSYVKLKHEGAFSPIYIVVSFKVSLVMFLLNIWLVLFINSSLDTDKYFEPAKLLNISELQMGYITNVGAGQGLLKVGSSLVPFINKFPTNTKLYKLMTTKPGEGN